MEKCTLQLFKKYENDMFKKNIYFFPTQKLDSSRRYDYIKINEGSTFGINSEKCSGEIYIEDFLADSSCEFCTCTCEDLSPKSFRHIDLSGATSDVENNK